MKLFKRVSLVVEFHDRKILWPVKIEFGGIDKILTQIYNYANIIIIGGSTMGRRFSQEEIQRIARARRDLANEVGRAYEAAELEALRYMNLEDPEGSRPLSEWLGGATPEASSDEEV